MGDEKSFSDWESVTDDVTRCIDENEDVKQSTKIIVELPPGGIGGIHSNCQVKVPNALSPTQNQASSIGSSFVRNIGALDLEEKHDASSSISSFVPVSRPKMRVPSVDESSWSHGPSELTYTASWTTATASTAGSITSNFEIISLSSGHNIMRCKRCKYHNPPRTTICTSCDWALIANPCLDMDEQIALALQRKEEQAALRLLQEAERKRGRIKDDNLFFQASFLTQEILTFLETFRYKELRILPETDMKMLLAGFIKAATAEKQATISLTYKFTASNTRTWNAVRSKGFDRNDRAGFDGTVVVSNNMEGAWTIWNLEQAPDTAPLTLRSRFRKLHSISEDPGNSEDVKPAWGWILAITESTDLLAMERCVKVSSGTAISKKFRCSDQVLPLVCFDSNVCQSDLIRRLVNGLSRICLDFFGCNLDLQTGLMPPPPPKKPKMSEANTGDIATPKTNADGCEKSSSVARYTNLPEFARYSGEAQLSATASSFQQGRGNAIFGDDMLHFSTATKLEGPGTRSGEVAHHSPGNTSAGQSSRNSDASGDLRHGSNEDHHTSTSAMTLPVDTSEIKEVGCVTESEGKEEIDRALSEVLFGQSSEEDDGEEKQSHIDLGAKLGVKVHILNCSSRDETSCMSEPFVRQQNKKRFASPTISPAGLRKLSGESSKIKLETKSCINKMTMKQLGNILRHFGTCDDVIDTLGRLTRVNMTQEVCQQRGMEREELLYLISDA